LEELDNQVELGQAATDFDYIRFQRSVNANVRGGPRLRQEILLRKAFTSEAALAGAFDPSVLISSGVTGRVKELGASISSRIGKVNSAYSATHGKDLFKTTNKTAQALLNIGNPIKDLEGYKALVDDLYFIFRESVGERLEQHLPTSFVHVNTLRTDLQHDVDHGDESMVKAKKKKIGSTFRTYSGLATPLVLDPSRFLLVQANLLSALELDLRNLAIPWGGPPV
jgi:hypothetical protein